MKLNKLAENKTDEYRKNILKFLDNHNKFYVLDSNKKIAYHGGDDVIFQSTIYDDFNYYIDDSGKCEVDFSFFDVTTLRIVGTQLKTLKNMPSYIVGDLRLLGMKNLDIFDLELQNCENLTIERCSFVDLRGIDNVFSSILLNNLYNINNFNVLPEVYYKEVKLEIRDMHIDSDIKTTNNNIKHLEMYIISDFKNFTNLPLNIVSLKCEGLKNLNSFVGIDKYKKLDDFNISTSVIKNIITLLLSNMSNNETLADYVDIINNPIVNDIINEYMEIGGSYRSERIMDCAVELIDAGFDEAAEL